MKSQLEDDVSAITMQPDVFGRYAVDDERLVAAAKRKARGAFSRRTARPVGLSQDSSEFNASVGPGITLSFRLIGPPQQDLHRVYQLAWAHVQAFFYWNTFSQATRSGSQLPGEFAMVNFANKQDWGNEVMLRFNTHVSAWLPRVLVVGADGFFKLLIRRRSEQHEVWGWGVEWNQNLRAVGFFGQPSLTAESVGAIGKLVSKRAIAADGSTLGFRTERAIEPREDVLFAARSGIDTPAVVEPIGCVR